MHQSLQLRDVIKQLNLNMSNGIKHNRSASVFYNRKIMLKSLLKLKYNFIKIIWTKMSLHMKIDKKAIMQSIKLSSETIYNNKNAKKLFSVKSEWFLTQVNFIKVCIEK